MSDRNIVYVVVEKDESIGLELPIIACFEKDKAESIAEHHNFSKSDNQSFRVIEIDFAMPDNIYVVVKSYDIGDGLMNQNVEAYIEKDSAENTAKWMKEHQEEPYSGFSYDFDVEEVPVKSYTKFNHTQKGD